ncbi:MULTISPECIES: Crp/Fnr family transcriptional regulator [Sphingobacterium]|uniref:Crp/Fnr family transcriptional regulator n=1 Tax=Sphingobacterium TaxID=28453 RepID=UPI0013D9C8E0|nr:MULTISPECIES: Crp/Fnr family transcriptional regulator [unclassified Sphingobacterium]
MRNNILFQHINQFIPLTENEFTEIIGYFEREDIPKKGILMRAGDRFVNDYFILTGCVHMYFVDHQGVEHTVQFALKNWWIADYIALQRGQPTDFYIQAIENSELLSISLPNREKLLLRFPKMESYFRAVYQIAYGSYQTRMKYILSYSKEEIYLRFRDSFPEFVNSVPQYLIASYLGLSAEYVSKLRRKNIS